MAAMVRDARAWPALLTMRLMELLLRGGAPRGPGRPQGPPLRGGTRQQAAAGFAPFGNGAPAFGTGRDFTRVASTGSS